MNPNPAAILDPEDSNPVLRGYQLRIEKHGATFASLNSGTTEKQQIRHQVHATALRGSCPTVLDVGCGLGDFYRYLKEQRRDAHYTGCDIVPEYIAECLKLHPEATFQIRDIFRDNIDGTYDTIVMSQV